LPPKGTDCSINILHNIAQQLIHDTKVVLVGHRSLIPDDDGAIAYYGGLL
jgi:hypothetical protein